MSPSTSAAGGSSRNDSPEDLAEIGHYVVTAHPPGAVFSSFKCNFLSSNSTDVVIAKSNRLEIRSYQPNEGAASNNNGGDASNANLFPLLLSLPINGRIVSIAPIRFPNATKDCLFFTTEKGGYALISYDESLAGTNAGGVSATALGGSTTFNANANSTNQSSVPTGEHYPIQTHATGTFSGYADHILAGGKTCECGPLLAVDPLVRCIALHVYDGYLTIIPINRGYDVGSKRRVPWRRNTGGPNADPTADLLDAAIVRMNKAGGSGKPARKPPSKLSPTPFHDAIHLRIEERTVVSMTFLEPCASETSGRKKSTYIPQLALMHQDARGFQHVISHGIDLSKKRLVKNGSSGVSNNPRNRKSNTMDSMAAAGDGGGKKPAAKPTARSMPPVGEQLKASNIEGGSCCLIPVPPPVEKISGMDRSMGVDTNSMSGSSAKSLGGVIILGHTMVTYHSNAENITEKCGTGGALLLSYCRVVENDSKASAFNSRASGNGDIDMVKYLLGDDRGRIHLLSLTRNKNGQSGAKLHFDTLGYSTTSSTLTYLSSGHVFIGSSFGNSQLIKILDAPVPLNTVSGGFLGAEQTGKELVDNTYVEVLEEFDNLGPIVDFDLRPCSDDNDHTTSTNDDNAIHGAGNTIDGTDSSAQVKGGKAKYQQSLMATCSGVASNGTVRIVRNGVGMREHAAVEMEGIKNMWSLRRKFNEVDDTYLVQSFVRETRVLGVQSVKDDEDMEDAEEGEEEQGALAEVTIPGFNSSKSTLFAGNLLVGKFDLFLQVVEDGIRLVDSETLACIAQWSPFTANDEDSDDEEGPMGFITVASANENGQIIVALRGGALVYLLVEGGDAPTIRRVRKVVLDREISCIDLNPFGSSSSSSTSSSTLMGSNSMDIDNAAAAGPTATRRETNKSQLVAVGLWDDFSVRLLNLSDNDPSSVLEQVLHINLGRGSDDNESSQLTTNNDSDEQLGDSGQHMMARSLCLVTMDSQSTNSNSIINKTTSSSSAAAAAPGNNVDMLLVGLGDGKLISFVVNKPSSSDKWSIHSRKEVSLGTQGVHLIPFQHGSSSSKSSGGSCVLATGDRPTVVYLTGGNAGSNSNPKLNYSTISLTVDDDDDDEEEQTHASHKNISVNVATPFRSSLLFSTSNPSASSLCIADENTLRLGMIDNIQKLHVTTYKLGMTPRRICHHAAGRVYCVGCVAGLEIGGEANQNNCVRFFDDSTFEELNCINLEPFEMILSIQSVSMSINSPPSRTSKYDNATDNTTPVEYRPFIVMGTAYAYPDEDEPSQGRVLVVECNSGSTGNLKSDSEEDQMIRKVRQVADLPLMGGIYNIAPFYGGNILVTCGSKTVLCQLAASILTPEHGGVPGELLLNHIGSGHHGHLISLSVKSLVNSDKSLQKKRHEKKQLAIVGDLMRSIALVEYYPKHQVIEELARDYNSNFCTEIAMLTNNIYMGSEGHNNLFVLQYNPNATSEQARVRLDTVGQYHLGESVNKMIGGSLIMPSNNGTGSSVGATASSGKEVSDKTSFEGNRKINITIGSQTLYGTVDGTIGSVLGLGGKTFAFLSALQRAMDAIVRPVGDLSHGLYRAWQQEQKKHGVCGFIDGDWIETFLDLNRPTMERVVKEMNIDKKWRIRDDGKGFSPQDDSQQNLMDTDDGIGTDAGTSSNASALSIEDVLGAVEELSMLH
eukprot:CAMPEP_0172297872 /NCGR_PEP_ID=MMETSP1058-20130122/741_1 /TAXON_ID=83371 /ORGANISM="Detonula confervacea, Strain CCMP 353" /LENGTH=1677 /DNA_ID=CAMNT_0013007075 /DNA_START=54 /DNA_END=5084 /DNA_ORIENTATION=-